VHFQDCCSLVNITQYSRCAFDGRYDVEVFQKIEEVRKVKLEEYVVQRGEIEPLMDSVNSALSLAVKQVTGPPDPAHNICTVRRGGMKPGVPTL
jgi:DNA-binding protein YbaB